MSYNSFSIRNFIHEYTDALRSDYGYITARPYNRFRPDDTKWWVVPSTVWPSFEKEKLCFWSSGRYLYGGFNVEKGISAAEGECCFSANNDLSVKKKRLFMTNDWKWNRFVEDCRSGEIDSMVDNFNNKVNFPVHMSVTANLVNNIRNYDPYNNKKSDTIEFAITADTLTVCDKSFNLGVLTPFEELEGLREVPECLDFVKGINWLWIDIMIFAPIYYIKAGSPYSIEKPKNKMSVFEDRIFKDNKFDKKAE